jgi:hypothetical protein
MFELVRLTQVWAEYPAFERLYKTHKIKGKKTVRRLYYSEGKVYWRPKRFRGTDKAFILDANNGIESFISQLDRAGFSPSEAKDCSDELFELLQAMTKRFPKWRENQKRVYVKPKSPVGYAKNFLAQVERKFF